jgi:nucleotide-binding universal stress UspA family protein
MYTKVLVPLDGSRMSEAVFVPVQRLAAGKDMRVILVTVRERPKMTSEKVGQVVVAGVPAPGGVVEIPAPRTIETKDQAIERARDEATGYLEEKGMTLRAAGMEVDVRVEFGDAAEEILRLAAEEDVDLIAMATHGRTGLPQVLFGGVAARVVGAGVKPVLLVRPDYLGGVK